MLLHKESGMGFLEGLINGFEPVMTDLGIGTIPEIFDGDPPHRARGAISQAASVAALLRIIEKYEKLKEKFQDISKTNLTN
jgi:glycogen debranching enzyme